MPYDIMNVIMMPSVYVIEFVHIALMYTYL